MRLCGGADEVRMKIMHKAKFGDLLLTLAEAPSNPIWAKGASNMANACKCI